MDIKKLKIENLVCLLNDNEELEKIFEIIEVYFKYRLFNKILCSDDELEQLEVFARMVKNMNIYGNKKQRDMIINDIAKLIVFSKDVDRYVMFCKLGNKRVVQLNCEEIIDYIDIMLSNCYCCFVVSKLDCYIRRYLELFGDIDKLDKIINNNSLIFSEKELKYLFKFIEDNYINIILKNILLELKKNIISTLKLYQYFSKLNEIKFDDIGVNNLKLFKNIFSNVKNSEILSRIDDKEKLLGLKEMIDSVSDKIFNHSVFGTRIRNDIILGNIILSNTFSSGLINNIRLINYNLVRTTEERIITIDDPMSPDLDGAFSIRKNSDGYVLKIYISDVPVFLRDNRELCKEAYLRGCSMYVRDFKNNCNINIDMLPQCLSHHYLSLNLDGCKNVIVFTFFVSNDGIIYSSGVDREMIVVTNKLSSLEADEIINSNDDYGLIQNDLRNYRKLCKVVGDKTSDKFLSNLNYNKMSDLIGFPSILVNYYIGHKAEFAIYRGNGIYTIDKGDCYTHSVTPLRKFVSDINLAFFLEQSRVVSFSDKDLYYVQDNVIDIINYLNSRYELSKFVEKNSSFVRKYIK